MMTKNDKLEACDAAAGFIVRFVGPDERRENSYVSTTYTPIASKKVYLGLVYTGFM